MRIPSFSLYLLSVLIMSLCLSLLASAAPTDLNWSPVPGDRIPDPTYFTKGGALRKQLYPMQPIAEMRRPQFAPDTDFKERTRPVPMWADTLSDSQQGKRPEKIKHSTKSKVKAGWRSMKKGFGQAGKWFKSKSRSCWKCGHLDR